MGHTTVSFVEKYMPWLLETDEKGSKKIKNIALGSEEIKKKAEDKNPQIRLSIASSEDAPAEILHNLAVDENVNVRRAVAGNKSTPAKTSIVLAHDEDVDVRLILAQRLMRLLPHLSPSEHSEVYKSTIDALRLLAEDKVTNIRIALSTSLKDIVNTPNDVAKILADDIEREVAEPIIRFSLSLSDEDLLSIITSQPVGWKVCSIAGRKIVSPRVSDAVIKTGNIEAGKILIDNGGAEITVETFSLINDMSESIPEWKISTDQRKHIPKRVSKKLTSFLDQTIAGFLRKRSNLDNDTLDEVVETARRRVEWVENTDREETPAMRVKRMAAEGTLTEEAITDALSWTDHEFIYASLGHKSGISSIIVRRILDTRSAKATLAVCKRAGISMRLAIKIQQLVAKVPTSKILYAKGSDDYPLSDDDMKWQLEFFGVE